jgi:LacI family gluconate utilization system Gnt-I transcriptional repressor
MPLDHRARKRFEGFTEALAKEGHEVLDQEFYEGGSALAKGRELTAAMMARTEDLDFIYYSNDLIGAGGLLWCLDQGIDVPADLGLAGFNKIDLIDGLPMRLASMDSCRREIGRRAAELVAARSDGSITEGGQVIELTPTVAPGDTLKRWR